MRGSAEFEIPYTGLGLGRHAFGFQLGGTFFQEFEPPGLVDADIRAETELDRFDEMMHFDVRVTGTVFQPSLSHMIKLGGARLTGYRTVSIAGARAPDFIAGLDDILAGVRDVVAGQFFRFRYCLACTGAVLIQVKPCLKKSRGTIGQFDLALRQHPGSQYPQVGDSYATGYGSR